MKVIKKADTAWTYKFTCAACDSELEAENKDLCYRYESGDMRDPGYEVYYVVCCVCSKQHSVAENKLSKAIKHEVKERCQRRNTSYFDR